MLAGFAVSVAGSLFLVACAVVPALAEGPWRGQIVDAETKEPLNGVVVLAVWTKHVRGPGGPSAEYYDSHELLTNEAGRFTVAARSVSSANPLVFFRGPAFLIFKPGYGRAVWPGYETLPPEKRSELGTYGKLLQLEGIVLELSPLKTVEERREYLGRVRIPFTTMPLERTPLLNEAIAKERMALGYGT